ncbi:uncharacterized protein LOC110862482 [Folsomia candida]|uniref:Uncharacterized protein n=1 Tax=Folsomia candida TaxID=158441 RepID=A0A226CXA6_FOLCA|nr:uncharacterized protein LOC110862482 [Folsomia candida]OXA37400.1 hypothetical protein Fcan01_27849 [Folsomia candida]
MHKFDSTSATHPLQTLPLIKKYGPSSTQNFIYGGQLAQIFTMRRTHIFSTVAILLIFAVPLSSMVVTVDASLWDTVKEAAKKVNPYTAWGACIIGFIANLA